MSRKPGQKDEDIRLFRAEIEDVEPLRQNQAPPFRRKLKPRRWEDRHATRVSDQEDLIQDRWSEHEIETGDILSYARPGVQHRVLHDLRRGRIQITMELDLHGLTVAYAHRVLDQCLHECRRRGIRGLHIIHGKGYGSTERQPVLKQKLNHWLRQRDEVLAFCSALPRDGGTGAVYVLLRHSGR